MARYPAGHPHIDFSSEDVERPHDYFSSEERETRRTIALLLMIVGVLLMALAVLMGWPFA